MLYLGGGKRNPLFDKSDVFAKEIYAITTKFPKHELYGITFQIRRAGLSVILNLVEGFARESKKENRRFQSIAYGSLREAEYLLQFSLEQKYITKEDFSRVNTYLTEISKMLWTILYKKYD